MRQNHFHVSAKTIDDTLLFPKTFKGENFLLQSVIESAQSFGVITKCYSSFPTGFEVLALCDSQEQAKNFTDKVCALLYEKNNNMGHIIDSFGVHITHVTNDEKMLYAIASDMMMRGMSARESYNTAMRN